MTSCRLIYSSQVVPGFDHAELGPILVSARRRNRRNDVTGCLFFDGYHFLQVLEGSSQDLNETFQRLSRDPRHHTVTLLSYGLAARSMALHGMAYVGVEPAFEPALAPFRSRGGHFVPELFTPERAEAFGTVCCGYAKRVA